MLNLIEVNEKVLDFLETERKLDSSLTYTFRKSNYNDRLSEGYWFYGTEEYLSVSFWSGMDWKNRTPNISFIILKNGDTFLEINVSDSDYKRDFVEQYLKSPLQLIQEGRRYLKRYSFDEFAVIDSLHLFINGFNNDKSDKQFIDEIIEEHSIKYFNSFKSEDKIYFIDKNEFRTRLNKVQKYREIKKEYIADNEPHQSFIKDKPWKLSSFRIENYGIIDLVKISNISASSGWIFITGENGSGKTNFLRAMATALGGRLLRKSEIEADNSFKVNFDFHYKETPYYNYERVNNDGVNSIRRPIVSGLAMYGPYRLDIVTERITDTKFKKELGKNESFRSLFEMGVPLLNIDKQFEIWLSDKKEREKFEKRRYYITSIFTDIVPSLYNIFYEERKGNKRITKYLIKNNQNEEGKKLSWHELSSGTKSVLAMVGDIMIRLFDQQRNIIDPSDLTGIVIIDEIDLHLHPKAQKDLVINLTKAFPHVQFIASTHSPIPLLGAPRGSVFIAVKRDSVKGVILERLKHLERDISKLTPNLLLSSAIFGNAQVFSTLFRPNDELLTEESMEEVEQNISIKRRLAEGLTQTQIKELKSLINSK